MIITCENCQTRFRLDESAISKQVFRVKCSKCDHTFTVFKPPQQEESPLVLHPDHEVDEHGKSLRARRNHIITVCNQKGGVSKTTTCLNLAVSLALMKRRVLLVDFDVQANLSLLLGYRNSPSFYDALHGGDGKLDGVLKNPLPNLWILPSNHHMSLLPKHHRHEKDYEYLLARHLEPLTERFDHIIIDTPPSIEFFVINALMASNMALIPTQCDYLAVNGVNHIINILRIIAEKTGKEIDYRILATMFERDNTASKVIFNKLSERFDEKMLRLAIEKDPKLQESQIVRAPVIYYDKTSLSGLEYLKLAKMVASLD